MTARLPPLPPELGHATDIVLLGTSHGGLLWRARLEDASVVVKAPAHDPAIEAEGLEALRAAGVPVPQVLAVTDELLVMEFVSGAPRWEELGAAVAQMHGELGETFGWPTDNVIGALPQDNTPMADWPAFYAERRIRPHLDHASLPHEVRLRLVRALDGPLQDLLDHQPDPSLVHGDLWSGNVVDGRALIDPAVHHADREFELAFADLFGGIPRPFWRGYADTWPLPAGWERRRPGLQLYHLLVHVGMFGAGYVGPVVQRLDELGW